MAKAVQARPHEGTREIVVRLNYVMDYCITGHLVEVRLLLQAAQQRPWPIAPEHVPLGESGAS